ncbi:MAG TPA: hypothetical protein PK913_11945, partial [Phenylobacterium sp.]|nr:hypothetical protein [Phenylobacterium sp.]
MIDIEIEDGRWEDAEPDVAALAEEVAIAALEASDFQGSVVILFTDDVAQQALNLQFRGKDWWFDEEDPNRTPFTSSTTITGLTEDSPYEFVVRAVGAQTHDVLEEEHVV